MSASSRAAGAALAALAAAGAGCADRPPDVFLVTLDTTRVDHLGVYGRVGDVSPFLDELARDAVVYRRAWSTAPWTLPAHASLFTGLYPTRHGAHYTVSEGDASLAQAIPGAGLEEWRVNRLGETAVTLAELLSARGYATAAVVGGPWLEPVFGALQGYASQDAAVEGLAGRPAPEITDAALAWLEQVPPEQPVHLFVNYFDPHLPYRPPALFVRSYGGDPMEDLYDGEIRFMDHHLGRLLHGLQRLGRYRDALVVVTADHGELLGEHGLRRHGYWLYEELVRVPLIVRFPGGRGRGTEVVAPISGVDVLPLIAAELGWAPPAGLDGRAPGARAELLVEFFRNPGQDVASGVRVDRDLTALLRWPWKLIASSRGDRELYRLDVDPAERENRSGDGPLAELDGALSALRKTLAPPRDAERAGEIPADTARRLRALGYGER